MTQYVELESELRLFVEALHTAATPLRVQSVSQREESSSRKFVDVVLPDAIDFYPTMEMNRSIYLWKVLEQLAFRQFGTTEFSFETACEQFPFLKHAEKSVGHRATDLETLFATFTDPLMAANLFDLLEAARLEPLILVHYPGSQRLRMLLQRLLYPEVSLQTIASTPYSLAGLRAGLRGLIALPNELLETVDLLYKLPSTVYNSVAVLFEWYKVIYSRQESDSEPIESSLEELPVRLDTLQRKARLEDWEHDLDELQDQIMSLELQLDPRNDIDAEHAEQLAGSIRESSIALAQTRDQLQRRIDVEKSILGINEFVENRQAKIFHYPEWNHLTHSYLPNHCTVYERIADSEQNPKAEALMQEIKPFIQPVRKQFEQLKPAALRKVKHVLDGEDIDIDSLITCRIDLKAGYFADQRPFSRQVRTQRDVSAVLLVDLSASTDDFAEDEPNESHSSKSSAPQDLRDPFFDDDEDPFMHGTFDFETLPSKDDTRKRIIDIEREAVLLLATALEDLGDLYAILGFSGYGRDNVQIEVAKEFNQVLNSRTVDALANLKPMRSTRMGPAIRHAAWHLKSAATAMKVLLVISDGFPQDHDYGPDRSNHEYGIQDTAKALQEASLDGIQAFCVTVDRSGHDYLRRMCPNQRYLVIEQLLDLPLALQKVYQQLSS